MSSSQKTGTVAFGIGALFSMDPTARGLVGPVQTYRLVQVMSGHGAMVNTETWTAWSYYQRTLAQWDVFLAGHRCGEWTLLDQGDCLHAPTAEWGGPHAL